MSATRRGFLAALTGALGALVFRRNITPDAVPVSRPTQPTAASPGGLVKIAYKRESTYGQRLDFVFDAPDLPLDNAELDAELAAVCFRQLLAEGVPVMAATT